MSSLILTIIGVYVLLAGISIILPLIGGLISFVFDLIGQAVEWVFK